MKLGAISWSPLEGANTGSDWREFIGLTGFEPATFRTRGERSTKLSHSPNCAPRENFKRRTDYFAHFAGSSKLYRAAISREVPSSTESKKNRALRASSD
jgi:hypothetical protein